jgi:hypothetical protein
MNCKKRMLRSVSHLATSREGFRLRRWISVHVCGAMEVDLDVQKCKNHDKSCGHASANSQVYQRTRDPWHPTARFTISISHAATFMEHPPRPSFYPLNQRILHPNLPPLHHHRRAPWAADRPSTPSQTQPTSSSSSCKPSSTSPPST